MSFLPVELLLIVAALVFLLCGCPRPACGVIGLQLEAILVGLAVTLGLGCWMRRLLEVAVPLNLPSEICPRAQEKIKDAMTYGQEAGQGGDILGWLERLLFFAALWLKEYLIIGGWLAFKLGSKWQTWQHIVKVPDFLVDKENSILELRVKAAFGSYQMGRFLIGTLSNGLLGFLGVVVGKFILRSLLCWCTPTCPQAPP